MTTQERNKIFETHMDVINQVINTHYIILQVCHLEREDVYQELSIQMLDMIEKYNAERCPNLEAYLVGCLHRKLLSLRHNSKRYGIPLAPTDHAFRVYSITECMNEPVSIDDHDKGNPAWIEAEIDALPEKEQKTINRLLDGERVAPHNKALAAARALLAERFQQREVLMAG